MIEKKHRALASIYLINDALASNLAMLAAWFLRFRVEIVPVSKGMQHIEVYLSILPLITIVFPLAFAIQGLYHIRPTRTKTEEWMSVAIGGVVATVILSGVLLWIRPYHQPDVIYSRATLGLFMLGAILFTIAGRTLVRAVVNARHRAGKDLDRVLIAGSGELARAVLERMRPRGELGFEIVGYLGNAGSLEGLQRLGDVEDAERVIDEQSIDHVFVALPHGASQALLERLTRSVVSIHVVPDLLQFMVLRSRVEDLEGL
ncbi:MAG TPA: hypothetical protein VKU62_06060, partial [Thermoanaerobaculia bacterium]|nr:hypothetical protein [Thermoanaerobaculia bacterium]